MEKSADGLTAFEWRGINKHGKKVNGVSNSKSLALLKAELRTQGIIVSRAVKQRKSLFSERQQKITSKDITVFLRQLSTMLNAGIPLVQAFDIISKGQENPTLMVMLLKLKHELEAGNALSEVLRKQPDYFNDFICNLIKAGEQSGSLDIMLLRVADYKEKMEVIRAKIKKALFYPAIVVVIALVVTMGLLIFVVPQFANIFASFDAELPGPTQVVMTLSQFCQKWWWVILGFIGAGIYTFLHFKKTSPSFAFKVDGYMLKLPVFGDIFRKAAIARFCRTLSTTFASGLPLVDCLTCVSGATGNLHFAKAAETIRDDVSTGQQLNLSMKTCGLFPSMVLQMVAIGEESGALDDMLNKVAEFYEEDVNNAVDNLSSLLEPLIMVIIGGLIGSILVAMYMPIFKLGSVI